MARCIREAGRGFMFAPAHHSAMKHVGPARAELGFRTVFIDRHAEPLTSTPTRVLRDLSSLPAALAEPA